MGVEPQLPGPGRPPRAARPPRSRAAAAPPPRLSPALALVPLRLFLGLTFVYAGIQKLSDPGFLHPGAPTYIGTQLHNFAQGTPGGFILRTFAIPAPKFSGVAVALVEIAVGLLVTLGLVTRAAAAVGLLLNLLLFLTNSWKTDPYFLGPDIVFVFAWLPFVLAGASGQPALDNELERVASAFRPRRTTAGTRASFSPGLTRRGAIVRGLGLTAVATGFLGAVAALAKGRYSAPHTLGSSAGASTTPAPAPAPAPTRTAPATPAVPKGAVKLGPASRLPRGQGATYNDPTDGNPDIVIRQSDGSLAAFSAVCTHNGCTVGYDGTQIACPCHGGTFDPHTGAVTGGPPPTGLARKHVLERGGSIYALPS